MKNMSKVQLAELRRKRAQRPGEVCVRWIDSSTEGQSRVRHWRFAKPRLTESTQHSQKAA